ncbi:rhamnan synthesis F family protein [Lichenibacterium dinghuense]|uniref:rhamnan synthesis F family protein n=1 Tax=Lichenibacterium dinghuense TaxID=2895977 RepID=UPI001F1A1413|nr:rhamnan synthesis F family protein [Lichenibacterium sp. 6Y81]
MTDDTNSDGERRPSAGESEALLTQRLAERLAERVAALEGENQGLREQVAAMLGSTSWRVTRPVRGVAQALRRRPAGAGRRGQTAPHTPLARPAPTHGQYTIAPGEAPSDPRSVWTLETGLFDASAYRAAAGLGAVSDLAAAEHYVIEGERRGIPPNGFFDPAVYAELHREVVGADIGLLIHYARYGRAEGRIASFDADADIRPGRRPFDPSLPTALLVCHEASRTGAPILGWNLARELNRGRNLVVALVNPGGDLGSIFYDEASAVVGPFRKGQLTWFYMARFGRELARRFPIDFAVANSIECQPVLIGLAAAGLPTVTLVHEYPTGPESRARMQSGIMLSQQVVFDARSQHEAALACWPGITPRNTHVFHQGASEVPADPKAPAPSPAALAAKRDAVFRAVRGDGTKPVVLGLGTVSMRKGPDLFVSCAAAAARRLGPGAMRFVWIGHTPAKPPEGDFPNWLADQVKRSGLGSDLVFLDAVDDLAGAYAAADAAMISSRLDPFPNVAMDAAAAGVPPVCFAEANGFADWLAADPRTAALSVPYLDADAAGAILAGLARDPERRRALGEALRERSARDFPMERYVARLMPLVAEAERIAAQEREDVALLLADDTFRADLWQNPHESFTRDEAVRLHVRKAASGQEANQYCRRPALGFVPQTYADHHPALDAAPYPNPLAHWIRAGKPAGPWSHPVLVAGEGEAAGRGASLRAALHLHLHYPELADDMLSALAANAARLDLFVSTTSDDKAAALRERFAGWDRGTVAVESCPNRGRDVGPMLTLFAERLRGYDVVGHLHGKRSLALTEVGLSLDLGVRWQAFLLGHLLGGAFPMADLILDRFAADERLGLAFPEDPNLTGWSLDREIASDLARRMDPAMAVPHSIDFPIGTMFWARPAALKPLFDLRLGWDDYPAEPVPIDGTMLHAIERLLPVVATHAGFGLTTTHVPGLTR